MKNCPACNKAIVQNESVFCPTCDWELLLIPDNASQGVKDYYSEKLIKHRKNIADKEQLIKEKNHGLAVIDQMKGQIADFQSKNKTLTKDNEENKAYKAKVTMLENNIKMKDQEINSLKKSLSDEKAAHEATKVIGIIRL